MAVSFSAQARAVFNSLVLSSANSWRSSAPSRPDSSASRSASLSSGHPRRHSESCFPSAVLCHGISQMLRQMKLVEDDLAIRFRHVLTYRSDVPSHMSIATAPMPPICSAVRVSQNPSRLLCLRPSATYSTRPRIRSFTSVR